MSVTRDDLVAWLAGLPDEEAVAYLNSFFVPASNPVADNLLLEAIPATPNLHLSLERLDTFIVHLTTVDGASTEGGVEYAGTPASTVDSEGTGSWSSTSAATNNKSPCGACQNRRKKCVPVRVQPPLCEYCEGERRLECPPHQTRKEGSGMNGSPKYLPKGASHDGFIYESGVA